MTSEHDLTPLSSEELAAETGTALPDKEVLSLLDLNVEIDLLLDLASPIDLAVAGNLNVAAPINASVGANVLSADSTAQALTEQGVAVNQGIAGEAIATAIQDSTVDQGEEAPPPPPAGTVESDPEPTSIENALDGPLLNVNVHIAADADLAAPIAGAVALNANVAAPIDAAVAANVGSVGSEATAISQQQAIINQTIEANAEATSEQQADIEQ